MTNGRYSVWVDETGDRGLGRRSSDIFVLSAVMARENDAATLGAGIDAINTTLGRPPGATLHWAENVKDHAQRKMVARTLGSLPMAITTVIVMKRALPSRRRLDDTTAMYNYAVRRLLERVSWYLTDRGGQANLTFAHVRRFPYEELEAYLTHLRERGDATEIRWPAFTASPAIDRPERTRGLQLADLVAGCLWAALQADRYGDYETAYLRELLPLVYVRGSGDVASYGMNVIGVRGCMDVYPWWRPFVTACARRRPDDSRTRITPIASRR
jgi:hypothetical protein